LSAVGSTAISQLHLQNVLQGSIMQRWPLRGVESRIDDAQGERGRLMRMTDHEKTAVWRQVDQLLADSSFSRSKRYPSLLRYIASRTLDGETDALKERILGIEVFGRNPGYDSTQDPIVRVTVAELRKRIVRYYQDPAHTHELRLDLHPGSYILHFGAYEDNHAEPSVPQEPVPSLSDARQPEPQEHKPETAASTPVSRHRAKLWLALGLCLLFVTTAALVLFHMHKPDAFEEFWRPLLASKGPILICTADSQGEPLMDADNPVQPDPSRQRVPFVSAETLAPVVELADTLSSRGHQTKVLTEVHTTLSDMGHGPLVLVGAFNNFWTLKFTQGLRFHFKDDVTLTLLSIQDTQDPNNKTWSLDISHKDSFEDYALVVRYREPSTRQWTVIVGGLTAKGNVEALRFLLSRDLMADLDRAAPKGWQNKNLEIVLKTDVINGNASPARIEAIHSW
jgi:hypothetical protein